MKVLFLTSLLFLLTPSIAQKPSDAIHIIPTFGNEKLILFNKYLVGKDSIEIHTLKFYLSDIRFYIDKSLVGNLDKKHLLMDLDNPGGLLIPLNKDLIFDSITFDLGIDSLTNISGVLGEDLDPVYGMYWTWQSGYINMKLEGKSSASASRNHSFTYHIGGYLSPYNALQTIKLKVVPGKNLNIAFDIASILQSVNLKSCSEIMSPGLQSIIMAQNAAASFKILP